MSFPFEVDFDAVKDDLDTYVDAIFGALESGFLMMPKGEGFVEFPVFDAGYEALKRATSGFREVTPKSLVPIMMQQPICLVVLRCMLGFTPPEWAYHASANSNVEVSQGAARSIDREIRLAPGAPVPDRPTVKRERIEALVASACKLLSGGVPEGVGDELIHRLDKADTRDGIDSVVAAAKLGVPYSMLLYERLLGRPFASHRDSVSELIGDIVENAVEEELARNGITNSKTKRAQRVPGFDQSPDFIVPNVHNPVVVIEAKLTEDDGTARDKVTRIQHLAELSAAPGDTKAFEVVACIAGRGFAERREDMRKLILATQGKVFTLRNMDKLVEHTRLSRFKADEPDHSNAKKGGEPDSITK